jgi:hypothetical protein
MRVSQSTLQSILRRLDALERRQPPPDDNGAAVTARLLARMSTIRERLMADPDRTVPTEEQRRCVRELMARLRGESV